MRHGSLFSGIGGFDLAAEWMGWENVFHCEWNEFGQKILKYYWPNAKSYGDITKTDFTEWRGNVDIVSGGFPCQPYSQAGKRKGKADDRHLWPEMLRAIREIQPRWIVGENVPGLLNWEGGMVLDEIKADLETEGFEVFPSLVLPACGKNAPHRRDRLWIIAHSVNDRYKTGRKEKEEKNRVQGISRQTMDTGEFNGTDISSHVANTNSNGQQRSHSEYEINTSERWFDALNDIEQIIIANSCNKGLQRSEIIRGFGEIWENGNKLITGHFSSDWQEFPTQPPICSRDDGLSGELDGITISKHRKESLMAYGNSVVPQIVLEIFKAIEFINGQ